MLIQIIISVFAFFIIIFLVVRARKADLKISQFLIWLLFWLSAGVAVWIPNFLTKLANFFGIGRGADLVLYFGIILVFYFIFRIYARLEKMERNITKIVRNEAIKKVGDENDSNLVFKDEILMSNDKSMPND